MKKQAILLAATVAAAIFSSSSMALPLTFPTQGYGGFICTDTAAGCTTPPTSPTAFSIFPNLSFVGTPLLYPAISPTERIYPSISWGIAAGSGGPFNGKSGASINVNRPGGTGIPNPDLVGVDPYTLKIDGKNVFDGSSTQSPPQELGNLTHWNRPIQQSFAGATVDIRYFLDVFDPLIPGKKLTTATGIFRLTFTESPNVTNPANCQFPSPPASNNPPCDDQFTYTLLAGFSGNTFDYNGTTYLITEKGFYTDRTFTTLNGAFYSRENLSSTGFVTEFKKEEVVPSTPEPATLALIGAGLLGAAATRRRSKAT